MQALARREEVNLPAINLSRPESMLSLPPWLHERIAALSPWGEGIRKDGKTVATIPASLTLSGPMRAALERRCSELETVNCPGPEEDIELEVAQLVARYATGKTGEAAAAIRIEWYMDVLVDQPAWAVKEALRRWRRGQCGPYNYDFAPSEAALRQIVEGITATARGQCVGIRRLLAAEPIEEPTEEVRAANRERFAKIMDGLVSELKGKGTAKEGENEEQAA